MSLLSLLINLMPFVNIWLVFGTKLKIIKQQKYLHSLHCHSNSWRGRREKRLLLLQSAIAHSLVESHRNLLLSLAKWIDGFSRIVSCPIISDLSDACSSITRGTNASHVQPPADGVMNFTAACFLIPSADWFPRLDWWDERGETLSCVFVWF